MNIYKALWSRIGGRPWTYILRDFWVNNEFFCIVILVSTGIILGHFIGTKETIIGLTIFSVGFLTGHLFWGTKYIPNQPGK